MPTSFQEKSLWLMMLSVIAGFGWYFNKALQIQTSDVLAPHIVLFVVMMVLLIAVQIIGNIVFAIAHRRELENGVQADERDKLINWRASHLASFVLAAGVFCSLVVAMLVPGNYAFMHVLLGFWAVSQIAELALKLVFHKRGV